MKRDFTKFMKIEGPNQDEIKSCVNDIFNLFIDKSYKECVGMQSIAYIYHILVADGSITIKEEDK